MADLARVVENADLYAETLSDAARGITGESADGLRQDADAITAACERLRKIAWADGGRREGLMGSGHPVIHRAHVWLDEDGKHIWLEHTCTPPEGPLERTMLPWPTWRHTTANTVEPSIHCTKCGLHFIANLTTDAPTEWAS